MKAIIIDSKNDNAENIINIIESNAIRNKILFWVESRKFW